MLYKKGELLAIGTVLLTVLGLVIASMSAIIKEQQIMKAIEQSYLESSPAILDSSLSEQDLKACKNRINDLVLRFDPFVKGLDKITIHKRKDLRRGLANKTTLQIRCLKDLEEFENVFIHELGHVVDLNVLSADKLGSDSEFSFFGTAVNEEDPSVEYYRISFEKSDLHRHYQENDFVSGYASSNVFEDFAEAFLMYIKYGDEFRELIVDNNELERKYVFIRDNVFDGYEFNMNERPNKSLLSLFTSDHNYPFDATVLHRDI